MSSATFIKNRIFAAEQFRNTFSLVANNTLYLTYGKVDAWANDSDPDIANTSVATENQIWSNMIGAKRLFTGDIVHVVPRFDWIANTVYTAYDHMNPNLYDGNTKFYTVTSDYNVYKCIANANGSISTVEPTAINPSALSETSDGYVWKYMFTVSDSDQMRFTTSQYIPVRTVPIDDGSLQWQVQDAVIEGQINSIVLTNNGVGYINQANIVVSVVGDGQSAYATALVNNSTNTISSIVVNDYGYGYSYATVSISGGGGLNANARAIISPIGGHGSSAVYELGASNLMINGYLKNSEQGVLPVKNDFRQVSLIANPLNYNSTAASNLTMLQAYTIRTVGAGDYNLDEIVYQGASYELSSFNGKIVSWDSVNGVATIINTTGSPTSQSLVGLNSSTSRFVSNVDTPDLKKLSGTTLYVNNMAPILRASDQTEDFKIVMKF